MLLGVCPTGRAHLEATISLATMGWTWRDSSGSSGSFVLILGAVTSGTSRPLSASGVPPGSITSAQLANGAADRLDAPKISSSLAVPGAQFLTSLPATVQELTLSAPGAGQVIVHASGFARLPSTGLKMVRCEITQGSPPTSIERPFLVSAAKSGGNETLEMPFSALRVFSVPPGSTSLGSSARVLTPMRSTLV
jgi:hypothetical protein